MGLFTHRDPTPPPPPPPEPERHGLFGRKKTPPQPVQPIEQPQQRSGLLHRNRTPPRDAGMGVGASGATRSASLDRRSDPSVKSARQRVAEAEAAERQADQALMASRSAVTRAREEVKVLEREAELECVSPFPDLVIDADDSVQGSACACEAGRGWLDWQEREPSWPSLLSSRR
jgi:hypothetical protein